MADDDDKPTTETPPAETPPATPTTPPATPPTDDGLRAAVARLEEIVSGLSAQVANLAPLPGDKSPGSKPWTHKTL